jgi:hypothetical protein
VPKPDVNIKSVHGTMIIWLQNDAGYQKWQPTEVRYFIVFLKDTGTGNIVQGKGKVHSFCRGPNMASQNIYHTQDINTGKVL